MIIYLLPKSGNNDNLFVTKICIWFCLHIACLHMHGLDHADNETSVSITGHLLGIYWAFTGRCSGDLLGIYWALLWRFTGHLHWALLWTFTGHF
jgi:hypothetical protein